MPPPQALAPPIPSLDAPGSQDGTDQYISGSIH